MCILRRVCESSSRTEQVQEAEIIVYCNHEREEESKAEHTCQTGEGRGQTKKNSTRENDRATMK